MAADRNRYRLLGWHAPDDIRAYVEAEATRRGVPIATVLTDTMRRAMDDGTFTCPRPGCGHRNTDPLDVREGFCGRCGEVTHPQKLAELQRLVG